MSTYLNNLGSQTVTWKYKTPLKGSVLSTMLNGAISPGIYLSNGSIIAHGSGIITNFAGNQIILGQFEAVFRCVSDNKTVHIGTTDTINLATTGGLGTIGSASPYIVMSYTWRDQIVNYIDFSFKDLASINSYDLVIGKAEFTGPVVTSIDYSTASHAPVWNNSTNTLNVYGDIQTAYGLLGSHPIGTTYMQHYGQPTPSTLYGGTWSLLYNNECISFMTEGSAGATYEAEIFDDNVKDSQMQGHIHKLTDSGGGALTEGASGASTRWAVSVSATASDTYQCKTGAPITDGTNGTPRTGLATKPRRRIVRIWVRTA